MNEDWKMPYWLGQRDMIANIFMYLRDHDEKEVIKMIANLYNTQFSGNVDPNPHIQHYLKNHETI